MATELDDGCAESSSGLKFGEELKIMFDGGCVCVCGLLAGCFPVIAFTMEHFFFALGLFSETDCQFYLYLPYLS